MSEHTSTLKDVPSNSGVLDVTGCCITIACERNGEQGTEVCSDGGLHFSKLFSEHTSVPCSRKRQRSPNTPPSPVHGDRGSVRVSCAGGCGCAATATIAV